jgi:hypothetical protein
MKAMRAIRFLFFLAVLAGALALYRIEHPYRGFGTATSSTSPTELPQ